jgi:predicted PhzF superfamily epimerase YddE/YHI9
MPESYIAAQGTVIGRAGRVYLDRHVDGIWVGGSSVTVLSGHAALG